MKKQTALGILAEASDDVRGEITMLEARSNTAYAAFKYSARINRLEEAAAILDRAYEHLRKRGDA